MRATAFFRLIEKDEQFVIRSQHNRILGETYHKGAEKLRNTLNNTSPKGGMEVVIQDVNSRETKTIQLNLKAMTITLPVPKKITQEQRENNGYKAITLNVVVAYNEEFEWKAMYVYFNEKIPDECPTIAEVMLRIARLGGYKPTKKSSLPRIKTIWIGYQQFTVAAQMYRNMSIKT